MFYGYFSNSFPEIIPMPLPCILLVTQHVVELHITGAIDSSKTRTYSVNLVKNMAFCLKILLVS